MLLIERLQAREIRKQAQLRKTRSVHVPLVSGKSLSIATERETPGTVHSTPWNASFLRTALCASLNGAMKATAASKGPGPGASRARKPVAAKRIEAQGKASDGKRCEPQDRCPGLGSVSESSWARHSEHVAKFKARARHSDRRVLDADDNI